VGARPVDRERPDPYLLARAGLNADWTIFLLFDPLASAPASPHLRERHLHQQRLRPSDRRQVERTARLKPIRILLAGMPRMLVDIVKDVIASHEDIDVAGEIEGHTGLLAAAMQTQADVVVLREAAGGASEIYHELLRGCPKLKILAITADGRRGFLHRLQPRVVALGELSSSSLIDAIRNASAPPVPSNEDEG
jgi:hypothetical protein